jgi:hypothetical protein
MGKTQRRAQAKGAGSSKNTKHDQVENDSKTSRKGGKVLSTDRCYNVNLLGKQCSTLYSHNGAKSENNFFFHRPLFFHRL